MRVLIKVLGVMMVLATLNVHAQTLDKDQIFYDDPKAPLQGYKYRYCFGFDITEQIMKPVNDFTAMTYNSRTGMNLYAAYRMRGPWGFELGYNWTDDKGKNIDTVPGTVLFNTTAAIQAQYQVKIRVEDWYLDAYWHYKYKKIVEFKAGLGVGFERQNYALYNPLQVTDPVWLALFNMYTHTTTVARFNLGVQTMLTKRLGARALLGYKTTSSIKMQYVPAGVNPTMFANSYSVAIGLFYTITGYYNE